MRTLARSPSPRKSSHQNFLFDTRSAPLEIRFFDAVERHTRQLGAVRALADQAATAEEKRNWDDAAKNVNSELRRLARRDASLTQTVRLSTTVSRCCNRRLRAPGRRSPRGPRRAAAHSGAPPGDGGGSSDDGGDPPGSAVPGHSSASTGGTL
jgi:hypothetical protein